MNRSPRFGGFAIPACFLLLGTAAALAQLPGDLDGNGEVNLVDLAAFVGCMNGPDSGSVDPACDPGNFDPDTDIDLRDFAGFQARFGFGQGPPQIISFTPAPGEWVVDDIGLTEVTVGFSEPVTVPADAVDVWLVGGGTVSGFTTSYDEESFLLTVLFASPLRDDRVTVVVDYTIEDVAGHPLDGEITDPLNAALPSGNGINGGQGVFRIHVLQGDANRDGTVDAADETLVDNSLNLCDGDPGFDANADLNGDGCVDAADENIVNAAFDNQLPAIDGVPPIVVRIREPTVDQQGFVVSVIVDFSEILSGSTIDERSCFLVNESGIIVVPATGVSGPFGRTAVYNFVDSLARCDTYMINVSNAIADFSGELLVAPGVMICP